MPILECKGVFELVIPHGWHVTGTPGEYYELVPPDDSDLGINLSVYEPTPEAMRAQGTAALLRRFANSTGFEAVDSLKIAEIADREQERAFARFTVDGRDWFVGFLLFPGGAVLATTNVAEGDEATFREGEKIVAMIAPAPRRGLFRRR